MAFGFHDKDSFGRKLLRMSIEELHVELAKIAEMKQEPRSRTCAGDMFGLCLWTMIIKDIIKHKEKRNERRTKRVH